MLSPASKSLLLLCARHSSALGSAHSIPLPVLWSVPAAGCAGTALPALGSASGWWGHPAEVPADALVTGRKLQRDGFLSPSEMHFSPFRASARLLHWPTGRRGANDSDEDEGLISMGRGGKRETRERVFHCNKIDTTSPRQSRSATSPSSPVSRALCLTLEDKWGPGSGCEVQRGTALLKASVNKCLEV